MTMKERLESQAFPGLAIEIEESDGMVLPAGWLSVSILNRAGGVAHRQMIAPETEEEPPSGE